jgi:hypothetical protein
MKLSPDPSHIWKPPTDESDPINVTVLYDSLSLSSNGCGHRFEWQEDQVSNLLTCPACNNVKLFADAAAISAGNSWPTILFKYGKVVFLLSLPSLSTNTTRNQSYFLLRWLNIFVDTGANSRDATGLVSPQQRIKQVLCLESVKILHKGKVIFDSQKVKKNESSNEEKDVLSKRLIDISLQDQNNKVNLKPSLVIMGTSKDQKLKDPLKNKDSNSIRLLWDLLGLAQLPFRTAYWMFYGSWWFVRSFVESLVPSWFSPPANNENSNNARARHGHND